MTQAKSTPTVTVTPSASSITTAQPLTVIVAVSGGGSNPTPTGSVTLTGGGYTSAAITLSSGSATINIPANSLSTGTDTLTVSYTPDSGSSSTYNSASGTASVAVTAPTKSTPTVTWATPAAITYGTLLSATQLDSTASVPGTFAYLPSAGAVLTAGTQILSVTFTPTDTTDYTSTTATVQLVVSRAVPTITWTTPAAITYGTALSATQLDAIAAVSGAFVYSPLAGNIPPVGSDTLSVTFTPSDTTDYLTATASVTLLVNNSVPVIGGMSPAFTSVGTAGFTLTVSGLGFAPNSTVYWGTAALPTLYGNISQLTAQVPAADIANAGITTITVQTPAPGGGSSNAFQFEVDSAVSGSITPPVFTPPAVSVTRGSTATYSVTLPSSATNVSVTCLNLPSGTSCSFSAPTNSLSITTSATTPTGTYEITVVFTETLPGAATALIFLPILLLPLAIARRKWNAGRIWLTAGLGFLLIVVAGANIGCGGAGGATIIKSQPATHQVTSSGVVSLTVQ